MLCALIKPFREAFSSRHPIHQTTLVIERERMKTSLVISVTLLSQQASGFSTPTAPAFLGRHLVSARTTFTPTSLQVGGLLVDDTRTASSSDEEINDEEILEDLLGEQLVRELCASERYTRAAEVAAEKGLEDLAMHLELEAEEERMRAAQLMEFADKQDIELDLEEITENVDDEVAEELPLEWDTKMELCKDLLTAEAEDTAALMELTEVAEEIVCDAALTEALTEVLDPIQEEQVDFEQELKEVIAEAVPPPTMKTVMNP